MPKKKEATNQRSINLPPEKVEKLNEIAKKVGSINQRGPKHGKPSWRAMVRDIADEKLGVVKNAREQERR